MGRSIKCKIRFVMMVNGTAQSVGVKTYHKQTDTVVFRKIAYPMLWNAPIFRKKNVLWYQYDIVGRQCVPAGYIANPVSPKLTTALYIRESLRQMTVAAIKGSGLSGDILTMIIMVILGLLGGFLLGQNVVL